MNKCWPILLMQIISYGFITGQEFVFSVVFKDTLGNSDTIELGYDENGTEGLDNQFGEVNIRESAWDSIFEVRITSELRPSDATPIEKFHSKKQILNKNCTDTYPPPIEIDIKAVHWPVTASWDSSLFQDSCNEGSLLTSIAQGGWWDVGSPSDLDRIIFREGAMITFTDNVDFYSNGHINPNYAYRDSSGNLISVFWVGLGKKELGVSTKEYSLYPDLKLSPNPIHDQVTITGISNTAIWRLALYTSEGKNVLESGSPEMSLHSVPSGVYILSILDRDGNQVSRKLVKN